MARNGPDGKDMEVDKVIQAIADNDPLLKSCTLILDPPVNQSQPGSVGMHLARRAVRSSRRLSINGLNTLLGGHLHLNSGPLQSQHQIGASNENASHNMGRSVETAQKEHQDEVVAKLVGALTANEELTSLNIVGDHLHDDHAEGIAEALLGNSSLTSVSFSFNTMDPKGKLALENVLADHRTIVAANLGRSGFSDDSLRRCNSELLRQKNNSLRQQPQQREQQPRSAKLTKSRSYMDAQSPSKLRRHSAGPIANQNLGQDELHGMPRAIPERRLAKTVGSSYSSPELAPSSPTSPSGNTTSPTVAKKLPTKRTANPVEKDRHPNASLDRKMIDGGAATRQSDSSAGFASPPKSKLSHPEYEDMLSELVNLRLKNEKETNERVCSLEKQIVKLQKQKEKLKAKLASKHMKAEKEQAKAMAQAERINSAEGDLNDSEKSNKKTASRKFSRNRKHSSKSLKGSLFSRKKNITLLINTEEENLIVGELIERKSVRITAGTTALESSLDSDDSGFSPRPTITISQTSSEHLRDVIDQDSRMVELEYKRFACTVSGWNCLMTEVDTTALSQPQVATFEQEIYALENLPFHQNVVKYLFHLREDRSLRFFTQRHPATLEEELRCRQEHGQIIAVNDIVRHALYIIRGLSFIHTQSIVHGDLRPCNLFVQYNERDEISSVAIGNLDKLCTRFCTAQQNNPTFYSAPEILRDQTPTKESDVYSFGLVLYELITLTAPTCDTPGSSATTTSLATTANPNGKVFERPRVPSQVQEAKEYHKLLHLYVKTTRQRPEERPSLVDIKTDLCDAIC